MILTIPRRLKRIMCHYSFYHKNVVEKSVRRNYNLSKILGKKVKELPIFINLNPKSKESKDREEVFNYFYKLGYDDSYICEFWYELRSSKFRRSAAYHQDKPLKERKDNQNVVTNTRNYGSGGSNLHSIRVPSKKHKNKYKNFLKLFPN